MHGRRGHRWPSCSHACRMCLIWRARRRGPRARALPLQDPGRHRRRVRHGRRRRRHLARGQGQQELALRRAPARRPGGAHATPRLREWSSPCLGYSPRLGARAGAAAWRCAHASFRVFSPCVPLAWGRVPPSSTLECMHTLPVTAWEPCNSLGACACMRAAWRAQAALLQSA